MDFLHDKRFGGIKPFEKKVWLSSPTMHGDEQKWVDEAIQTNWVSTVGENINEVERQVAKYIGTKYAVGLSCGTAALHLATHSICRDNDQAATSRTHGHKRCSHICWQ